MGEEYVLKWVKEIGWGILSMDIAYGDFLKRLREERISRKLTQLQMGSRLRMSQSHYSKAELGTRKFTFYEMQSLCETELDVFYILTGIRLDGKYREVLETRSYHELSFLMRIVCYLDSFRNKNDMQYYLGDSNNIFYSLRRVKNYSQKKMSELLGMDVKKLRDMEKGVTLPDSEMILKMYHTLQVPFFVILKEKNLLVSELCYMLGCLEKNTSKEMFGLIQDCVNLME